MASPPRDGRPSPAAVRRRGTARLCVLVSVLVLAFWIAAAALGRVRAGDAFLGAGWPLLSITAALGYLRGRR